MTDSMAIVSCRDARHVRGQVILLLVLLGSLALGGVCRADDEKNVALFNELNRSGTEAYEKHDFKTAIRDFQQAYSIKPEPLLFYNIAQCYRKINHDAEAITFYQSYLRRPEDTDPELRAKAEGYLAELRGRHLPQPQLVYIEDAYAPRPRWRFALGGGMLAVSAVMLGFGGRALDLNGHCVDAPVAPQTRCNSVADTQALGIGLVVPGALLAVGGVLAIALPGPRHKVQRPAAPTHEDQPGVVKPLAELLVPVGESALQVNAGL